MLVLIFLFISYVGKLNLMNNREFKDYWSSRSINLNIERFMNTINNILNFTIIENNEIMSN